MAETTTTSSSPYSIGRVIDYILGRNTLIGIASFMLLIISGYATWHGMRDFIIGVSATANQNQQLPGGMSFSNDFLVIAVVVALTFLMWLTLRETFGAQRDFRTRIITFPLYVFLAVWSIGFGYGFWWSLISGEEATRTGLAGLQEDARDAAQVVAARLDAVRGQLDSVVTWSDSQMTREETSGGSCGTASGAGRGPLYNARRSVRDSITTLRDGMTKTWLEPVQADIEQLRQAATALGGATVEERQRAFEAKASEIRGRARNIAARSNQLGKSTAGEMRALASTVAIAPGAAGFSCYDPTLAERLRAAGSPGRAAGRTKAARGGLQRRAGRRRQRRQEPVAQHRRLHGQPVLLPVHARRHRRGRSHRYRRADHRPRPDRAARHHRHRPGPAGAGDRQPAARAALDPPIRCPDPADQRGDRHGDRPRQRHARLDPGSFHQPQARVLSRDPQSLQLRSQRRAGEIAGARHEPAGRRSE